MCVLHAAPDLLEKILELKAKRSYENEFWFAPLPPRDPCRILGLEGLDLKRGVLEDRRSEIPIRCPEGVQV